MSRIRLRPGEPVRLDGQTWFFQRRFAGNTLSLTAEVTGEIRNYSDEQLLEAFAEGRLQLLPECKDKRIAANLRRDFVDCTTQERDAAIRRSRYATPALKVWPCDDDALRSMIAEVSEELADYCPPKPRTVRRWVRCLMQGNGDIRSLIPLHCLKGNRRARISQEVLALALECLENARQTRDADTISSAHDEMAHHLNERNKGLPERRRLSIPSKSWLYRVSDSLNKEDETAARKGQWHAERLFRSVGKGLTETRPLENVEFDFTTWDTVLIDEDTCLPVGRPTVAVGYDRCTDMPWGVHISYELESYLSVMLAVRNGILPKTYVKSLRYGSAQIDNPWPCFGVPEAISSDNALALRGTSAEHAFLALGIDPRHMPRRRPDLKPKVERFFGTVRVGLADWLPGKTYGAKETDFDPSSRAILTIQELRFLLHKYLIDIYAMEFDKALGERRIDKWNRLTETFEPRLPFRVQDLDCLLAAVAQPRTVSKTGIRIFGLDYRAPALADLYCQNGSHRVQVRYDPGDLSRVWACLPGQDGETQYVPLEASDVEYVRNLTLWQHRKICEFRNLKAEEAKSPTLLKAKHDLRQIVIEMIETRRSGARRAYRFLNSPKDPAQTPPRAERKQDDPTDPPPLAGR